MNIGDWLAKVLLWVVGLAVITVVLAVVPFIFHWNLLEALASGACTAGCFAVSMLYRKWKGGRARRPSRGAAAVLAGGAAAKRGRPLQGTLRVRMVTERCSAGWGGPVRSPRPAVLPEGQRFGLDSPGTAGLILHQTVFR